MQKYRFPKYEKLRNMLTPQCEINVGTFSTSYNPYFAQKDFVVNVKPSLQSMV